MDNTYRTFTNVCCALALARAVASGCLRRSGACSQNTVAGTLLGLIFIVMIFEFPVAYKAVRVMRARGQIPSAREAWDATKEGTRVRVAACLGCLRTRNPGVRELAATCCCNCGGGGAAGADKMHQNPLAAEMVPGGGRTAPPPPPME